MKIEQDEHRKLDAWIAENIFSYKWGHFGFIKNGLPELKTEPIYLLPPNRFDNTFPCGQANPFPRERVETWNHRGMVDIPYYSSDSHDAMELLKKCVTKLAGDSDDCVMIGNDDQWNFIVWSSSVDNPISECFGTIEMAICQFAKKIFSPLTPPSPNSGGKQKEG